MVFTNHYVLKDQQVYRLLVLGWRDRRLLDCTDYLLRSRQYFLLVSYPLVYAALSLHCP